MRKAFIWTAFVLSVLFVNGAVAETFYGRDGFKPEHGDMLKELTEEKRKDFFELYDHPQLTEGARAEMRTSLENGNPLGANLVTEAICKICGVVGRMAGKDPVCSDKNGDKGIQVCVKESVANTPAALKGIMPYVVSKAQTACGKENTGATSAKAICGYVTTIEGGTKVLRSFFPDTAALEKFEKLLGKLPGLIGLGCEFGVGEDAVPNECKKCTCP